jgi:pimeloyl-ACP methyl ester carboxylesterase
MLTTEVYGQGPALVLIHGSPGNARTWQSVGQNLADRFAVVAVNLPDYDQPRPPDEVKPSETDAVAEHVEETIKDLPSPITLAAHSYGANIALRVAMRGNVKLNRLVLLEPVTANVLKLAGEHELYDQTKAVFDGYIEQSHKGDPLAVKTMIDFWFGVGAFEKFPEPVQSYLVSWSRRNVADVEAGFRETFTNEDLAAVECPVRVVYGTKSPNVTRVMAETIASSVPHGRALSLATADHNMVATHPEKIAAIINGANGD